jgi:bifunctional non-homologous end joining protein LigD
VKMKKTEKEWLLIKERDSYVRVPGDQFVETSVLSGLTVDEVKLGKSPVADLRRSVEAVQAPHHRVDPHKVEPMLAESTEHAFTRDDWIFELKLDGYRLIASKTRGEAMLMTRNGNNYTAVFPEVTKALEALPFDDLIIDGEVVVLDEQGRPSFARLQRRGTLHDSGEIKRAAVELPATFFAFDFLAFEDFDLRSLPLVIRKQLLFQALPKLGAIHPLDHIEREGEAFLKQVEAMHLEGIIAKKADAHYKAGRSDQWLKIKAEPTADFVIVGFTNPQGTRTHFGALQLADYVDGALTYAGRVGTGFNDGLLSELGSMLESSVRESPPCGPPIGMGATAIPETKTTTWVEPRQVCEVRFREWTPDGVLRHAAFMRMRYDKDPHECVRQGTAPAPESQSSVARSAEPPAPAEPPPVEKTFNFSNLKKVYWPKEKYTKGDLIDYYRAIAPWMLPYLRNRPLVMTRFPDGIEGKQFYQKDAPEFAPSWIATIPIWSEDTQRDVRYFVANDVESLLYVANLGSIPIHIWNSRVGSLEQPDWCVIDLDPKEAPFSDVIKCAVTFKALCDVIHLPSFIKTTGKTGLHIMIPLGRQLTYAQCRTLGELLARVALRELDPIATITRHVSKRGDKVYLDYLQNRHGQLIVSPFCVRPLPGATVSMPLLWDEVDASLDPKDYTIKNAIERMETLGKDPLLSVLDEKPDLGKVLEKLGGMLGAD